MLLIASFTASAALNGDTSLAQSRSDRAESSNGQVGKLVIDGKATELKYAYARRDWPGSPLIDLIITNQPLRENTLAEILDFKYRGSDKLRGLWLIFDSSGAYKGERLLLQSGSVPAATGVIMHIMSGNGDTRVENGRIRGKIESKIESPARTTTFAISFEAPLKMMSPETDIARAATSTGPPVTDLQNAMRGKWSIEKWRSSSGQSYTGVFSVEGPLEAGKLRGMLQIVVVATGQKVDEEVLISREGTKVHMEGQVAPGVRWIPDIFTLEFKDGLLLGSAGDQSGSLSNVVLRKIP
jgi:hypothetical protein